MKKIYFFIVLLLFSINNLYSENEKGLKIKEIKGNEGKRWAICIGINDYEDENITDLKKAQNDALSLSKVLNEKGQFDKVVTLVNDYEHYDQKLLPTKSTILKMLDYLLEFSSPEDLVVFSFSGHGISNESGEDYLVTQDTNLNDKFNTSLKVSDITDRLKQHNIKKSLLLLDACREEITQTKGLNDNKGFLSKEFKESEVAAAFYSTKAGWFSYEDTESDYGVFTRFLLEGLNGKADYNNDSIVSFNELENYVEKEVNDYSLKNNRKQKPYTKIYGEKFGDLALTTNLNLTKSISNTNENSRKINDVLNLRSSLKAGEEFSSIIISWTPPEENNFDGFILLRQEGKPIDYSLLNKSNYIEGEKISGTDVIILKTLSKSNLSFIDTGLKENTEYYYKIFVYSSNNNLPGYSSGVQTNTKTLFDGINVNVKLDSIRVLKVNETSEGAELYWSFKLVTSTNENYILDERERDKYWAAIKGDAKIINLKQAVNIKLPKNGDSYFEIIATIGERDDVKDGWYQETGPDNYLIKKKAYRFYIKDNIYKQHTIVEEEKDSAQVEIKWTISKN